MHFFQACCPPAACQPTIDANVAPPISPISTIPLAHKQCMAASSPPSLASSPSAPATSASPSSQTLRRFVATTTNSSPPPRTKQLQQTGQRTMTHPCQRMGYPRISTYFRLKVGKKRLDEGVWLRCRQSSATLSTTRERVRFYGWCTYIRGLSDPIHSLLFFNINRVPVPYQSSFIKICSVFCSVFRPTLCLAVGQQAVPESAQPDDDADAHT
jgi:hypothetical protein